MNAVEAMKALVDGKKVRRIDWSQYHFYQIKDEIIVDEKGYKAELFVISNAIEYEIYNEDNLRQRLLYEEFRETYDEMTKIIVKLPKEYHDLLKLHLFDMDCLARHALKIGGIEGDE